MCVWGGLGFPFHMETLKERFAGVCCGSGGEWSVSANIFFHEPEFSGAWNFSFGSDVYFSGAFGEISGEPLDSPALWRRRCFIYVRPAVFNAWLKKTVRSSNFGYEAAFSALRGNPKAGCMGFIGRCWECDFVFSIWDYIAEVFRG